MSVTIKDGAAILSVREDEIANVYHSPAGVVIVTTDGVSYVDVPADAPDADGKTGLMFLAAPKPGNTYVFPIYAQPVEGSAEASAADAAPAGPIEFEKATAPAIKSWVGEDPARAQEALAAELERPKPRKAVVSHLESLLENVEDERQAPAQEPSDGEA